MAACTGTKQCWERGKKSCGVLIASYYSAHSAVTHTTTTTSLYTVSPNMAPAYQLYPNTSAICSGSSVCSVSKVSSLQCLLTVDGLQCDWTWPLATLCCDGCGAAMQCAVITYSWGAGTLGVIVMVTRPQTLDHPHLHTANILLLLLRNQLKPDPIKEVPKYYRALIWVSFSYQSRTT